MGIETQAMSLAWVIRDGVTSVGVNTLLSQPQVDPLKASM